MSAGRLGGSGKEAGARVIEGDVGGCDLLDFQHARLTYRAFQVHQRIVRCAEVLHRVMLWSQPHGQPFAKTIKRPAHFDQSGSAFPLTVPARVVPFMQRHGGIVQRPAFASATGLRPEEWAVVERGDIDRQAGVVSVRRFLSDGQVVDVGKTDGSVREVPLSPRALDALDGLPARLDTPLLFPAPKGGHLNLDNFRRREWRPAIVASGVRQPARLYDLRSTFASNALASGVTEFELAKVMGTSGRMIEKHYGRLLQGAAAGIAQRLGAFEVSQEQARDQATDEG